MMYARDAAGMLIPASRGLKAICPCCREPLQPRCGEVKVWHWAHIAGGDCDAWFEPETAWHRDWKMHAPADKVEVPLGEHRADIIASDGAVIELQNSPISPDEIRSREQFYGKMLWLLNGGEFLENFRVELGPVPKFSWSPPRPSWLTARKSIFVHGFTVGHFVRMPCRKTGRIQQVWRPLQASNDIFQIRTMTKRGQIHGTGRIITTHQFLQKLLPRAS